MNITKSNDPRRMFVFEDNDHIPFESIFEQESVDYQVLTPGVGSVNPSCIPFPWKLHEMLDDAEKDEGFQSIISWLPDHENAFRVHNAAAFVDLVIPKYFNQTKYKSFQRQVNIWGFCRIPRGRDKGGYVHPCFIRGKPSLCRQMVRQKSSKGGFSTFKEKTASVVATHSVSSNPLKTCFSSPCLMHTEFGDAPFFSPASPAVARSSSLQPPVVSYELLLATSSAGVLLGDALLEAAGSALLCERTDVVKNYSTTTEVVLAKSSIIRHQPISPRTTSQSSSRRHHNSLLKQWIDIHDDDDEQALLQVFPSNFDPETIFL
jgi:hypothetical protein